MSFGASFGQASTHHRNWPPGLAGSAEGRKEPVTFVTWFWHSPDFRVNYLVEHVNRLAAQLKKNMRESCRVICVADKLHGIKCEGYPLWPDHSKLVNPSGPQFPSCYRRLKLFSTKQTRAMGIARGTRVVSLDLDTIVTGDLTPLFDRDEDFLGWKVPGPKHPLVFNGSLTMFRAEAHSHLWEQFNPQTSPAEAWSAGYFGSDQGWVSYCMRGAGFVDGWDATDGVHGYRAFYKQPDLPEGCRLVSFCGKGKPWHPHIIKRAPWLENYR